MYIEKRKSGRNVKYYLVHSYREGGKVRKIRKYLGQNLTKEELSRSKAKTKKDILKLIDEISTEVFQFKLTDDQIKKLNRYEDKISIFHLDQKGWQRFTEEFVYNTNAIEGSTVRRDEVPGILKKRRPEDDEEKETKGVADAVDFIRSYKKGVSSALILKLHKLCFSGSKHFAGRFRDVEVVIRDSQGNIIHNGCPAEEIEDMIDEMVVWHSKNKKRFKPLVLAAIIHNQFEHIHPFQDGNGRVGRLLLNFILIKNNHPPVNIHLEDRREYYRCLREYDSSHDVKPMLRFLIKQYKKILKEVTTKKKYL